MSDTNTHSPEGEDMPASVKRRKSPEQRVSDIIEAAADHFAEVGFDGGTREIAKRLGVTQPLLYRYFPDKDSLIEAVYRTVYLESWVPEWDAGLLDRSLSVKTRYLRFYRAYVAANFNPRWLRIAYMAGLRDAAINEWYNHLVEELILLHAESPTQMTVIQCFPPTRLPPAPTNRFPRVSPRARGRSTPRAQSPARPPPPWRAAQRV